MQMRHLKESIFRSLLYSALAVPLGTSATPMMLAQFARSVELHRVCSPCVTPIGGRFDITNYDGGPKCPSWARCS